MPDATPHPEPHDPEPISVPRFRERVAVGAMVGGVAADSAMLLVMSSAMASPEPVAGVTIGVLLLSRLVIMAGASTVATPRWRYVQRLAAWALPVLGCLCAGLCAAFAGPAAFSLALFDLLSSALGAVFFGVRNLRSERERRFADAVWSDPASPTGDTPSEEHAQLLRDLEDAAMRWLRDLGDSGYVDLPLMREQFAEMHADDLAGLSEEERANLMAVFSRVPSDSLFH